MIITGAFLAEAAAAADNKLHVWGGVLSHFFVGPDRFMQCSLVVLLQHGGDDSDRVIIFELIPPNGEEPLRIPLDLPESAFGGEIAFALYPIGISMPFDGRWVSVVSIGDPRISLPIIVQPMAQ